MIIEEEKVISMLRWVDSGHENYEEFTAPFSACCTILWETHNVIWIKGLVGKLNKEAIKLLIKFCIDNNISLVKAYRLSGRMPFLTKKLGHYCEIDVLIQKEKLLKFIA
jgi:hypothetical protein